MKLEAFVSETLKQIVSGIASAQEHAEAAGGVVCPLHLPMRDNMGDVRSVTYRTDKEHLIEFDVALTTTETAKAGGGLGIFVAPLAVGGKRESAESAQYVSRLKFSIPIVYPKQTDPSVERRDK